MTKRETFEILKLIGDYYGQFTVDQQKIDAWNEALKTYSFQQIKQNLVCYVTQSPAPPKISDLVKQNPAGGHTAPGAHQTLDLEWEPAVEQDIREELQRLRKILGIRKD
ncbi:hypothetical protein D0469_19360 [Peribacillus saganii]|uniref:Uncharacterized protein n=1 Tax=Peribacillus saganii TaxID=2303992 RepID=A0A372LDD5_9BACI|nr:replicative helicase loader/inhibitor [Peribacillus saganii]RFU63686.1 hypothetical protein D0469_19360 [Peribacillus saganii]